MDKRVKEMQTWARGHSSESSKFIMMMISFCAMALWNSPAASRDRTWVQGKGQMAVRVEQRSWEVWGHRRHHC